MKNVSVLIKRTKKVEWTGNRNLVHKDKLILKYSGNRYGKVEKVGYNSALAKYISKWTLEKYLAIFLGFRRLM